MDINFDMKKKQSEFTIWFKTQYGKRPKLNNKTDGQIDKIINAGENAKYIQTQQILWDGERLAALRAWIAKDTIQ